ncbi:MAG: pyruvate dehydrogenase (acetyl-transferring) E1 component subunit alpha [Planctomycetota bacterium]
MTPELLRVISQDGTAANGADPPLSEAQLLELYRVMVTSRALDERAMKLQRQGRIGFYVPAMGQEASHVGSAFALRPIDWVFPSYRNPGVMLLRGVTLAQLLHQCYGNARDSTKGRQMPVHYSFKAQHIVSISSPIGTQLVQAAGVAMAARIRGDETIAMAFCGEGATSSNDFHSGLNFAAVRQAPVVFVCENNGWAISCPGERQTRSAGMAIKARAYGMPGIAVDGNDVLAVYSAAKEAVDRAREGGGPSLIETVTFRIGPHSSSDDPTRYRPKELSEEWVRQDPIPRFRSYLVKKGLWNEESEQGLADRVRDELQAAIQEAEEAGPPAAGTLFEDVFAEIPPHLQEQREQLLDLIRRDRGPGGKGLGGGEIGEFPL